MEFNFSVAALAREYNQQVGQHSESSAMDCGMFFEVRGDDVAKKRLSATVRLQLAQVIDRMG